MRKLVYWHTIPLLHGVYFRVIEKREIFEGSLVGGEEAFDILLNHVRNMGCDYRLYLTFQDTVLEEVNKSNAS